jgi:hypothetical protein
MAFTIRPVEYYYANIRDFPEAAFELLSQLADLRINLLDFTAVPTGPTTVQFAVFPMSRRDWSPRRSAQGSRRRTRIMPCSLRATTSSARSRACTNASSKQASRFTS